MNVFDYFCLWLDAYQIPYVPKINNAIALTFDDGPHPEFTPNVLAVLETNQAKATFFVVGQQAKRYPHLIKAIVEAGHEIANHSWSHDLALLQGQHRQHLEIRQTQLLLTELTGQAPVWYRPPFGIFGWHSKQILQAVGVKPILWSQSLWDYKQQPIATLSNYFQKGISKEGCVYLMHDGICKVRHKDRQPMINCLALELPKLLAQGITCHTLSGLYPMDSSS